MFSAPSLCLAKRAHEGRGLVSARETRERRPLRFVMLCLGDLLLRRYRPEALAGLTAGVKQGCLESEAEAEERNYM